MFRTTFGDLLWCVRTDGDDRDTAFVELWPELFPSPQLGDTVGSPVPAKKLDERGLASQSVRIVGLAMFIKGAEVGEGRAGLNRLIAQLLATNGDRQQEEGGYENAQASKETSEPSR